MAALDTACKEPVWRPHEVRLQRSLVRPTCVPHYCAGVSPKGDQGTSACTALLEEAVGAYAILSACTGPLRPAVQLTAASDAALLRAGSEDKWSGLLIHRLTRHKSAGRRCEQPMRLLLTWDWGARRGVSLAGAALLATNQSGSHRSAAQPALRYVQPAPCSLHLQDQGWSAVRLTAAHRVRWLLLTTGLRGPGDSGREGVLTRCVASTMQLDRALRTVSSCLHAVGCQWACCKNLYLQSERCHIKA
jgi:hypothetical protein